MCVVLILDSDEAISDGIKGVHCAVGTANHVRVNGLAVLVARAAFVKYSLLCMLTPRFGLVAA
jgi:hypothetical protein